MGIPHSLRVKMLQTKPELRDPRRLGKVLPLSVAPFKRHMPLLMHGKRITFGETVSQQNEHKTPAVFYPNVIHAFVYSRLLNMSILIKMSTTALREIEYSAGGLDEYLLTVSDAKLGDDWIARMYRDKVREAWKEKYATGADDGISESRVLAKGTGDRILPISKKAYEEFQILSHYGEEYMRKLVDAQFKFENSRKTDRVRTPKLHPQSQVEEDV